MSEWQDISTAPRDGSKLDLWCRFERGGWKRVPDAHYNHVLSDWQLGDYNASDYMARPDITHWMPIPNPPGHDK